MSLKWRKKARMKWIITLKRKKKKCNNGTKIGIMLTIIWNWKRKWYVFMGIKIAIVWTCTGHRHQCFVPMRAHKMRYLWFIILPSPCLFYNSLNFMQISNCSFFPLLLFTCLTFYRHWRRQISTFFLFLGNNRHIVCERLKDDI